jgi:mevalonate pyrophosphate decarboxylase
MNIMAKKIKVTQKQLEEAVNAMRLAEANDNMTMELGGNPQDNLNKRVRDTMQNVRSNGVDPKKVDINIPNETALNCSKVFTKSQLVEARRKYLQENSNQYTKENFIKK